MSLLIYGIVVTLLCMSLSGSGDGDDHPEKRAKAVPVQHVEREEETKEWVGGP